MSLLEKAQEIMGTFDPEKDSVSEFENLPDGDYLGLLEEVTARKSEEKGTEWISLSFSVIEEGEYQGRLIFVNFFFTEKTTDRSIKGIIKTAHDFGYELPTDAFADLETLAEYLGSMAGETAIITQKTSKSGFANFTVVPQA